jgi:LDH2 family malate/lactate/ureidoglycolate dehydrogenase
VISGANFGGEVGDQYKAFDRAQDVGHFFLAMKPNLFVSEDDYRARIDTLIDRIKASPLAEGSAEVLVPGEPEDRHETQRRKAGIPYAASEVKALQDEAKRAGIQPLVVAERPIGT